MIKKHFKLTGIAIIAALAFTSCSLGTDTEITMTPDETQESTNTCKMYWDSDLPSFDDEAPETRAISKTWSNGSILYLRFKNGSSTIAGTASYSASSGWQVSYSGTLPTVISDTECEIYYVENQVSKSGNTITLNESSVLYQATGTYTHPTSDALYITGTLKPHVWRMRFRGNVGTTVTLPASDNSIQFFTSLNVSTGSTVATKKDITLTVDNTGFTPYIYGDYSTSSTSKQFSIYVNNSQNYYRTLSSSVLPVGKGGFFTIPTNNNVYGWTVGDIVVANCEATAKDFLEFTDGMVTEFDVTSNVHDFIYAVLPKSIIDTISTSYLISVMSNDIGTEVSNEDLTGYIWKSTGDAYKAGTDYVLCTIAYDADGNRGRVIQKEFTTRSKNLPVATLSNLEAATSSSDGSNIWQWDVSLDNNATAYYIDCWEDEDEYNEDRHWNLYWLYYQIKTGKNTDTFDWTEVYLPRDGDYLVVCTWAIDGKGNIGNDSWIRAKTSSSVKASTSDATITGRQTAQGLNCISKSAFKNIKHNVVQMR